MNNFIKTIMMMTTLNFVMPGVANANIDNELLKVQQNWAIVNYQMKGKSQESAFEELILQISQLNKKYETQAEGYIWNGIIKSSFAGVKGGLGALSLAKESKKLLEKSIEINATALNGSAYTSLGTLYSQVPGWPIGFGSDKKAKKHFAKALEINPKGIDPNYFYAQFLFEDEQYRKAKKHLQVAQQATPRENRSLADSSRQQEITDLLVKVDKKLKKRG